MGISDRQQREKEHRIRTILEAAKYLFARKGYQETSLNDIADQAELGKATIYYYFKCKDDIYKEIYLSYARSYYQALTDQVLQAESLEALVSALVVGHVQLGLQDRDFFNLLFPLGKNAPVEILRNPEVVQETESYRLPIQSRIQQLFRQVHTTVDPEVFQQMVWSYLTGLAVKIIRGADWAQLEPEIHLFQTSLLDTLTKEI
ncbi:MAG: TetR/AcrR family transcriptional regulator [Candidatus Neomarinimicrobiota bacterium]|nr:MAG: TetR/AcrR family transcriptional regulator [Candidatus Neomarinimicrobiota bacterium]